MGLPNFALSVQFLVDPSDGFAAEGGYVNDPKDPGGETKYGISKRAYPKLDIKNLTLEQAKAIYYRDYWVIADCESLGWPLCFVHFDTAVNNGVHRAMEFRQACQGDYMTYLGYRRSFYTSLNNPRFIKGWLNRLEDIKKYIEKLAPLMKKPVED